MRPPRLRPPRLRFGSRVTLSASPAERLAEYTSQTQFVGGRNFFRNGEQWIDMPAFRSCPMRNTCGLNSARQNIFSFSNSIPRPRRGWPSANTFNSS